MQTEELHNDPAPVPHSEPPVIVPPTPPEPEPSEELSPEERAALEYAQRQVTEAHNARVAAEKHAREVAATPTPVPVVPPAPAPPPVPAAPPAPVPVPAKKHSFLDVFKAIILYLPMVLEGVVAVEKVVGAGHGQAKKDLVLGAISAAAQAGEGIPEEHVSAVSTLIDKVAATLKAAGLFGLAAK